MSRAKVITVAAALVLAAPLQGQTQAQQDRIDTAARRIATLPMCEYVGIQPAADAAKLAQARLFTEVGAWGLAPERAKELVTGAVAREERATNLDLGAAVAAAKTDAQLRGVRLILVTHGRVCDAAAADPLFASLLTKPPGYDLEAAATAGADTMLEIGGLASWQTPVIQARGDLMMLAGSCRSKIGGARSDALRQQYGRSDDARARDYYARAFDEGLADPTSISTLAGCNRAIRAFQLKARGE